VVRFYKKGYMDSKGFITRYKDKNPTIHRDAFVDVSSRIIGDVNIGAGASIWPMAVLRADSEGIRVGRRAAILDLVLIEAPKSYPVIIEEESIISHNVVIHGAHIHACVLVGIGAIVLEGAVISSGSVVGAGSVVTAGTFIPPDSLVMGTPAKVVRETSEKERRNIMMQVEELYAKSREYKRLYENKSP